MSGTGRFESDTTAKIRTQYGTVLKVSTYEEDCNRPTIECKIRGKCKYCGDTLDCWCFSDDEFDDPLQEATECLSTGFICESPECVMRSEQENDPEELERLKKIYGDDEYAIRDAIQESWGEWDEAPLECGC